MNRATLALSTILICATLTGCGDKVIPQIPRSAPPAAPAELLPVESRVAMDPELADAKAALAAAQAELKTKGDWVFYGFMALSLLCLPAGGLLKWLVPGKSGLFLIGIGIVGSVVGYAFLRHGTLLSWVGVGVIGCGIVGVLVYVIVAYRDALLAMLHGTEWAKSYLDAPPAATTAWDTLTANLKSAQSASEVQHLIDAHLIALGYKKPEGAK